MKCLTSPNNREQGLSVIEFDKKSNLISLVFVKLFKTQNELLSEQDTKTLLFINILFFLFKILTTPMVSHNQNLSLCSLVILPPIYQHFLHIFPKDYNKSS